MNRQKEQGFKIALDTSFLIRLLSKTNIHNQDANLFVKEFKNKKSIFYISTITLAEYLVKGKTEDLPLEYFRLDTFNHYQAEISANIFNKLRNNRGSITRRALKDDVKILAQAIEKEIDYILCADSDFETLIKQYDTDVKVINILNITSVLFFNKL